MNASHEFWEQWFVSFLVILLIGSSIIPMSQSVKGDGSGTYPSPEQGDWIISNETHVRDEIIIMNGNVLIKNGASLHLENVTLLMNATSEGEFRVEVESGASLYFYNSSIDRGMDYAYGFWVNNGGKLRMEGSTVNHCGYNSWKYHGMFLDADDVVIRNSLFFGGFYGTYSYKGGGQIIEENTFINTTNGGIYLNSIVNSEIRGNNLTHTNFGIWSNTCNNVTIRDNEVYNVSGQSSGVGIYTQKSHSITIRNNIVNDTTTGIYFHTVDNSTVEDNIVTHSWIGTRVQVSQDMIIQNQEWYYNDYGLYVDANNFRINVRNNIASINRVYNMYFLRTYDSVIEENEITNTTQYHGLCLNQCQRNVVRNNTISGMKSIALFVLDSVENIIIGNEISNSPFGYYPFRSNDIEFIDGNVHNNNYGVN